ncbi:MAG TPA: hypothetical protein VMC41_02960 [Candidatus Nanoarchaeia archaeon]|nr:hypothetical protein [Candidatus Nanoarchaeia archaeon]
MAETAGNIIYQTGNVRLDNGLNRINRKITEKRETFGPEDLGFIVFLIREKLGCEKCRDTLLRLYLHLSHGRTSLHGAEWSILGLLLKNKVAIGIPELQAIPSGGG